MWEVSSYVRYHCREEYPYSHNYLQILSTDLHTFSLRVSWENLIEDQHILPLVIILSVLITFSLDGVWKMLEENWCKDKAIPQTESEGKWVIKTSLTHVCYIIFQAEIKLSFQSGNINGVVVNIPLSLLCQQLVFFSFFNLFLRFE